MPLLLLLLTTTWRDDEDADNAAATSADDVTEAITFKTRGTGLWLQQTTPSIPFCVLYFKHRTFLRRLAAAIMQPSLAFSSIVAVLICSCGMSLLVMPVVSSIESGLESALLYPSSSSASLSASLIISLSTNPCNTTAAAAAATLSLRLSRPPLDRFEESLDLVLSVGCYDDSEGDGVHTHMHIYMHTYTCLCLLRNLLHPRQANRLFSLCDGGGDRAVALRLALAMHRWRETPKYQPNFSFRHQLTIHPKTPNC